jgi:lipopolysaccharide transport system ATP-binding protein
MSSVITVENLSKRYIIGHQKQERYTALRDVLANGAKRVAYKLAHPFSPPENDPAHEEFWALKDVSFDIQQGDRVGIIGRNGAGKSTLLKVLSRITEPTSGRVSIKGRVASLLEVGTGFHPELTGRENIFLNGAILGMGKAEIKRKFDEIVSFAEVEKFLDTPVKRYSSGMYVRLAFAVAAHLEPEILIVDEVLAVGDAQFQMKCMGKMEQVGKDGRTVIFVSHNLGAVGELCTKGVLLANGQLVARGMVSDVLDKYNYSARDSSIGEICWGDESMPGDSDLKLKRVSVLQSNKVQSVIQDVGRIDIEMQIIASRDLASVVIGLIISSSKGQAVLHTASNVARGVQLIRKGSRTVRFSLPPLLLSAGNYSVTVGAAIPNVYSYFLEHDIASFKLETANAEVKKYPENTWKGVINPQIGEWIYL